MIRYYGLLALGAGMIICLSVLFGSLFVQKKRKRQIQSAFEAEYQGDHASCALEVRELVNLYLAMTAKHGPNSEEAKAFRFGTDSHLMQRIHGDDGAMQLFNEQADIIDQVCTRLMKKGKKGV